MSYGSERAPCTSEITVAANDGGCRSFVVLPAAGHLRRVLGPSTWAVLESLLARSTGTTEDSTVAISIRDLAADVAVSKDTVTRAIGQLVHVGLLAAVHLRTAVGTFGPTQYRVTVPSDMFDLSTPTDAPSLRTPRRPSKPIRSTRPAARTCWIV